MENLENLLNMLADLNDFDSDPHSPLNQIIADYADDELSDEDLDFVSAAADCQAFRNYLEQSD